MGYALCFAIMVRAATGVLIGGVRFGFGARLHGWDAAGDQEGEQADVKSTAESVSQACDAGLGVLVDHGISGVAGHARVVERLLQVRVGHERHAGRQLVPAR